MLIKTYWHYKVKPKILTCVQKIKDSFAQETKVSKIKSKSKMTETIVYQFETKNEQGEKLLLPVSKRSNYSLHLDRRQKNFRL